MQEAVPVGTGGMLVVLGEDPDKLAWLCDQVPGTVSVANYNGPGQTVLSGNTEGITHIKERLAQEGIKKILPLPVSAPFHCDLMKPAQEKLANYLTKLNFKDSHTPILSNVTARPETCGNKIRELLIEQVTAPVLFTSMIRFLKLAGVEQLIEIGPGKTLTNLVKRIDDSFIL
jgi:[acyl-carrier-protein] S-malonyltransferase